MWSFSRLSHSIAFKIQFLRYEWNSSRVMFPKIHLHRYVHMDRSFLVQAIVFEMQNILQGDLRKANYCISCVFRWWRFLLCFSMSAVSPLKSTSCKLDKNGDWKAIKNDCACILETCGAAKLRLKSNEKRTVHASQKHGRATKSSEKSIWAMN